VQALGIALRDPSPETRELVAIVLGELGSEEAERTLRSAVQSERDSSVRTRIEMWLRFIAQNKEEQR
jgi:HEAT repeat protein